MEDDGFIMHISQIQRDVVALTVLSVDEGEVSLSHFLLLDFGKDFGGGSACANPCDNIDNAFLTEKSHY